MTSHRRALPSGAKGQPVRTGGARVVDRQVTAAALLVLALLAAVLIQAPTPSAQAQVDDDQVLHVVDGEAVPPPGAIALDMRAATPQDTETVIIARDDNFADALASGVLQSLGPLYLVPTAGPLPDGVRQAIQSASASRAIILGGELAVSPSVAQELEGLDLVVQRRQGFTRIETAVSIARTDAPDADTVILARAFPSSTSTDPSQAYADAIAAGGLAARTGWPILLTETSRLSAATQAYLADRQPDRVLVIGGLAAIGQEVENALSSLVGDVERVAGATRSETAVEVAAVGGDPDATSAQRVILVDGQSDEAWAAGVVAASHAALHDAPIILAPGGVVSSPTKNFLDRGVAGISGEPVLTCVVPRSVCDEVAAQIGILDEGLISVAPAGGALDPDDVLRISGLNVEGDVDVSGTCGAEPASGTLPLEVTVSPAPAGSCFLLVEGTDLDGASAKVVAQYNLQDPHVPILAVPGLVEEGGQVDFLIHEPAGAEITATASHVNASGCLDVAIISPTGDDLSSLQAVEQCTTSGSVIGPLRPVVTRTRGIHRVRLTTPTGGSAGALVSVAELQVAELQLGGDALEVTIDDPGEVLAFEFNTASNILLTLAATDVTVDDCERILIYSPTQRQVGGIGPLTGCDSAGHRVGTAGPLQILESGVHRMLVSINGEGTGTFTVDLLPVLTNQIAIDSTVNVRALRPGQAVVHSFDAVAGQRLAFAVTDANVNDCERVFLLDPFGDTLDEITPDTACTLANHRTDSGNPRTIPQTGTYTLVSYVRRGGTGRFEVHLTEAREGLITPNAAPVAVDVDRPGRAVLMFFDAEEGAVATIASSQVDSNDCEQVDLFDPSFELIGQLNPQTCSEAGTSSEPITLPSTGQYIAVGTIDAGGTGQFGVTIGLEQP